MERCGSATGPATVELLTYLLPYWLDKFQCYWMLLDYLLPILQDSIITDMVRPVNLYLGKYQTWGNSQSEQLFVI